MNRAYSFLTIKRASEDERVLEGIASTPHVDKVGDIVEPMGAQFRLPMPFLWQHRHSEPIGHVTYAKPTPAGIPFRAKIAKIDEPGKLKDRVDEAWQSLKSGLVSAVSIGFMPLDAEPLRSGGMRFKQWRWDELSAVTIPAGIGCDIQTVKRYDREALAAAKPCRVVRLSDPVSPSKALPVVRLGDSGRRIAGLDPTPSSDRPIAEAMLRALDLSKSEREQAEEIVRKHKALGISATLLGLMTAGTKATDAEIAALRARLDRLERGN